MSDDVSPKLKALLEVWKACIERHKFHDNLKQERARRFTTVQIALSAGFGISLRALAAPNAATGLVLPTALVTAIVLGGILYSEAMIVQDARAADYVRISKNQTRNVERQMLAEGFSGMTFLPYEGQLQVLNLGHYKMDDDASYVQIPPISRAPETAHGSEQFTLKLVRFGWLCASVCTFAVTVERVF